ncbi:MAG: DUF4404 family protein [Acidobacteriota bacterium]
MPDEKQVPVQNPEELREKLQALHDQLQQARNVDEPTRELLRDLMRDTRELLENPGEPPFQREHSLRERLQDSMALFETSHPDLAWAVAQVVDTLSGLGI